MADVRCDASHVPHGPLVAPLIFFVAHKFEFLNWAAMEPVSSATRAQEILRHDGCPIFGVENGGANGIGFQTTIRTFKPDGPVMLDGQVADSPTKFLG